MRALSAGFTLIELMIAITIFAVLTVMAIPMYSSFVVNSQIRTATESMLSGVRYAQTEAVKRNGQVEFRLDPAVGWQVVNVEDNAQLHKSDWTDGAPKADVQPAGAARRVTFNGLGRILPINADGSVALAQVDVGTKITSFTSQARNLRLVIGLASGIKACDPALATDDPAGCP